MEVETAIAKSALRKEMRRHRSELSQSARMALGNMAQRNLLATDLWGEARVVGLYAAMPEEAPTCELLDNAWQYGKEVWLPRITDFRGGRMIFAPCVSMAALKPGPMGIMEPDICSSASFEPDIMVIPALAFDMKGWRLGYGGGFYDRYLDSSIACPKVGLCFSFQIIAYVPHEKWDRPVDYLCTDRELMCL